jgi:nicotinate-nucleotide adenylyltransferase
MVELAIAGNPGFRASDLELRRPGPSYASDTVRQVAFAGTPDGRPDPVFILSVEALAGLPSWRDPQRLLDHGRVAVVPRHGAPRPSPELLPQAFRRRADRFLFLGAPDLGHSSSAIRDRVAAGLSIRYLVPDAVEAYIRRHHLYVSAAPRAAR